MLLHGETGIGKTRFLKEAVAQAEKAGFQIYTGGRGERESVSTLQPFLKAFPGEEEILSHNVEEAAIVREVFLISREGLLITHMARTETSLVDKDIVGSMFTAIQDFVIDSFGQKGSISGLDKLEMGDIKIRVEHGKHVFLLAVVKGSDSRKLRESLNATVRLLENRYSEALSDWNGNLNAFPNIEEILNPVLSSEYVSTGSLDVSDLQRERTRIFEAFLEHMARESKKAPILFVLDDFHWADPTSLKLLLYLARNIRKIRVLICAAVDETEASLHPSFKELTSLLRELRREKLARTVELERLTFDNVRLYIQLLFAGIKLPEDVEKKLFHLSEGIPLILEELIQSLIDGKSIYRKDGGWRCKDIGSLHLSQNIKDLMGQKLDTLSDMEISALRYSSVMGPNFHYDLLQKVVDMGEDELLDVLEGLCRRNILFPDEKDDMVYVFSHRTLKDVVYSEIQGPRRRIIHLKVARAIESGNDGSLDEVSHLLAHHYSQTSEHEKAFRFSVAAAGRAYSIFAVEEALLHYHNALDIANKLDTAPKNLVDIILDASRLSAITGDFENAQKLGKDAHKLSRTADDRLKEFESIFNEGWIQESLNNWTPAIEMFSNALTVAEELNYRYGIARSYWGIGKIYWWQGEYERAREYCEKSAKISRTIRDEGGIAQSVLDLGNVFQRQGRYDKARESFMESISYLERENDLAQLARAYNSLGTIFAMQKRWNEALPHYQKSLETARKIRFVRGIGYAAVNMTECLIEAGQNDAADSALKEAKLSFEKIADLRGQGLVQLNYGIGNRLSGKHETALEHYKDALEFFRQVNDEYDVGYTLKERALVHLESGRSEDARRDIQSASKIFEKLGSKNMIDELFIISKDVGIGLAHPETGAD